MVINTPDMESCASACRDARLVRPLKTLRAFASTTTLFAFKSLARTHEPMDIDLHSQRSGRTNQCILTYILNGADARTVRPYMPVMAILMCKMVEITSCTSACRDARLVRPLKNAGCIRFNNHAICLPFILRGHTNQCISTYIHNGTDARTVRPYMPLAYKSS